MNQLVLATLSVFGAAHAALASPQLEDLSLPQLEQRLAEIDTQLKPLARFSLRGGVGAIGFRSTLHDSPDNPEWIEIRFDREYPIDEIMLVPTIWRDAEAGFRADAFPAAFRILVGTATNRIGTVVASYDERDHLLPRIAPLVVPLQRISASWVRLEATRLSLRAFDRKYVFQLSELLVFSGLEDVALHQIVNSSSNVRDLAGAWNRDFLVDGFMPYLMNSARENQSLAFVSPIGTLPVLTLDLGAEYPLSRIHLHTVDQDDTVPQAYSGDLGIPRHLRIDGAKHADFSDAVPLLDYRQTGINDTGPIMLWRVPETTCRYVRLAETDPDTIRDIKLKKIRIGFAEIELFSKDRNVALAKPVRSEPPMPDSIRNLASLTDGKNLYGKILPLRNWLEQLARRHNLEVERPLVATELAHRYARQKINLNRMSWLAALLAAGIGFTILIDRNLRMRQATRIKERFAADLHDELGANLHTIGLLVDLAKDSLDSRAELTELLDRCRLFTERSGIAARHCINMLEARSLCEDLVKEMKYSSSRLLADLTHEISFAGEAVLQTLSPRQRIDLFFFYKECLTNIIRHSGATSVSTRMQATPQAICLTVTDNGRGIDARNPHALPPSLKRRARLLGAQVTAAPPAGGGTHITLKLKLKRFGILK